MQHEYRGHRIRLVSTGRWTAELIELASGTILPTKVIAEHDETLRDVSTRARRLVDLYLDTPTNVLRVLGPARPWQTVFN